MGLFWGIVACFFCFEGFFANAKQGGTYPPPTVIEKPKESVSDSVAGLFFSEAYSNQIKNERGRTDTRIHTGMDLTEMEVQNLKAFLTGPGDEAKKSIFEVRYGVDAEAVIDTLIAAKKAKIATTFVTDLNRALNNTGEAPSSDFEAMTAKTDPFGQLIEKMLAAKFKYDKTDYKIVSIPVYPDSHGDRMKPIMHLKILILIDENHSPAEIRVIKGTNNLTLAQRINTAIENADPDVAKYYLDHVATLVGVLQQGQPINKMPILAPLQVNYGDGYRMVRFTDGHFNPNDSIAAFLTEAADSKNGITVDAIHAQEFVVTHRATVEALKNLMKVQADFKFNLLADSLFVSLEGYGLASVFEGFDVYPTQGGKATYGVNSALLGRSDIHVYAAAGRDEKGQTLVETDRTHGHLMRKLEHNKIFIVTYTKNGEKRARIFMGSLNLSNHFDNAEDQEEIDVPVTSWIYKALIQDYMQILATQSDRALSLPLHLLREGLGRLTGHTDLEVSVETAQRAYTAALARDYSVLVQLVDELRVQPTHLSHKVAPTELERRSQALKTFLDWYDKAVPTSGLDETIRLHKLISVTLVLSDPDMPAWRAQSILNAVLWRPQFTPAQLQQKIREAWHVLSLKDAPNFTARAAQPTADAFKKAKTYGGLTHWNFDWDDNVMFMPTPIVLFKKGTDEKKVITTQEFASIRDSLGRKSTDWADWEIRTGEQDSFYRFRKASTGNYFLDDILQATKGLGASSVAWQGPSWRAFVTSLSSAETAANVRIITARENTPEEILEGLTELQRQGWIKYLPPVENIKPVGGTDNPARLKVAELRASLRASEKIEIPKEAPLVMSAAGHGKARLLLWGFSDDDWGNYTAAKKAIQTMMKKGEIQQTKVTLFFTGRNHPQHPSEIKILTPDGGVRDPVPSEKDESLIFLQGSQPDKCDTKLKKVS
jgi:hypothetical protein